MINLSLKFLEQNVTGDGFYVDRADRMVESMTFSVSAYAAKPIVSASVQYATIAEVAFSAALNEGYDSVRLIAESSELLSFFPPITKTTFSFEATN